MSIEAKFANAVQAAWQCKLDVAQLINLAVEFEASDRRSWTIVLYQTWLQRNPTLPFIHVVFFNLGVTLSSDGDIQGAEAAYRNAIKISPSFTHPRLNLGLLLERKDEKENAIAEWRWIEQNAPLDKPDNKSIVLTAINHMGRVCESIEQYGEALRLLNKSLIIEPNQPDVLHHWVYLRQKQCAWPVYAPIGQVTQEQMAECTSALAMINLTDDPAAQLLAARRFVARKVKSAVPPLSPSQPYRHKKLRIAYLSSDFCLHPVSMLTVQMFELHNRDQFEVYAYCWSPEDGSPMRRRVIAAMDHFHRINQLSDEAAAQLIREHEIDILIDLQGQTSGARADLLAYRPAPIQMTYLGLPATTGLPSIDYVIADRLLIPETMASYYSEKPLYMPDVYQVSDRLRQVGTTPSRESCGLPADAFVFCSFNNNFKYTPEMFDAWMGILRRVPNSVFWLLADNFWAQENLRREAENRMVDPARLIFAGRVAPENYLARYAVADLFLDSFPFNAGTTANDALWMGLPVLTRCGRAFASRMAGALLTAAGLSELITDNVVDYEEKAVQLANNPEACRRLREHLRGVRENGVLFDTPRFVLNLEAEFKRLLN